MAVKFHTKEWIDKVKEGTKSNTEYQKSASGLSFKSLYVLKNCPGGVDRKELWTLDKGVLTEYTFEEKPSPTEFATEPWDEKGILYRCSGDYDIFVQMNKGELAPMQAIAKKVYKLEGPMMKIMGHMAGITALSEVMSSIDCEY